MKKRLISGLMTGLLLTSTNSFAERVKLLSNDQEALQARADLITQAKNEVLAEYFEVSNDSASIGGLALLLDAAQKGKDVKIIVDSMYLDVPVTLLTRLEEMSVDKDGVQKLQIKLYNSDGFNLLNPLKISHRDHAKLLIGDGERLITGGRNVGRQYFGQKDKGNYRDLDVITENAPAAEARESFLKVWNSKTTKFLGEKYKNYRNGAKNMSCSGKPSEQADCRSKVARIKRDLVTHSKEIAEMLYILKNNVVSTETTSGSDIIYGEKTDWLAGVEDYEVVKFMSHKEDDLVSEDNSILAPAVASVFASAKESIDIVSPYVAPPQIIMNAFKTAVENKVKISLATNSLKTIDSTLVYIGYNDKDTKGAFTKMGFDLFEYQGPQLLHAKAAVIDNEIVMIGTYNLDPRSANINREVGLYIKGKKDSALVKGVKENFEDIKANSLIVAQDGQVKNKELWKKGASSYKRFKAQFLKIFKPLYKNQI